MFGRQRIRTVCRGVVNHAAGHHGAQPLAHVAFVEPGRLRDLLAGGRRAIGQRVKESDAVANADHERDSAVVHDLQHVMREGVGFGLVERGVGHIGFQTDGKSGKSRSAGEPVG